jgi:hypothetical protein
MHASDSPTRRALAPLVLTQPALKSLHDLAAQAAALPVDIQALVAKIATPDGKRAHKAQMSEQTVVIPGIWPFLVTYSEETGHPIGRARHMSLSIDRPGRVPSLHAVWLIAEILGFRDSLETCHLWIEDLEGHGKAVNVAQEIA